MYISKQQRIEIGDKVTITKEISTISGTFTTGHVFTVESKSERGLDLIDKDGHKVGETRLFDGEIIKLTGL